jgi:hypothetical protein
MFKLIIRSITVGAKGPIYTASVAFETEEAARATAEWLSATYGVDVLLVVDSEANPCLKSGTVLIEVTPTHRQVQVSSERHDATAPADSERPPWE